MTGIHSILSSFRGFAAALETRDRVFPTHRPAVPGFEYFCDWRPGRGLNADYVDYFTTPEGEFRLAAGDVTAKDVPVAPLSASLHRLVRALDGAGCRELPELMARIGELFGHSCPDGCYATLFVASYDPDSRRLRYINAGHESPLLLRKTERGFRGQMLAPSAPVIGMLRKFPYQQRAITLRPGDLLAVYTDGLCGATDATGEEWGWQRFLAAVQSRAECTTHDMVQQILAAAESFSSGGPAADDMTLWIGRVTDCLQKGASFAEAEISEETLAAVA